MTAKPFSPQDALARLAPGTLLRTGLERIIQQGNGALIVIGSGPDIDALSSGGFRLDRADFTPARLAEVAKMDGAILLSKDASQILGANVHLVPDSSFPTDETGARHRTAERVAAQTGHLVLAVSEDRGLVTVFLGGTSHELERPTALAAKVNESLHGLERFRRRLDDANERLARSEFSDQATFRSVIEVLQRAELVNRLGAAIEHDAVALGEEATLVGLQLRDLVRGVDELRDLTLADYIRPRREHARRAAVSALGALDFADLHDTKLVAGALGFDDPDAHVRPVGHRVLDGAPRVPDNVRSAVLKHFKELPLLLSATVDELDKVEGVGRARAEQLRDFLDRAAPN